MREPLLCLRCGEKLKSLGKRDLQYGPDYGEILATRMRLHGFMCVKCGHMEFFDSKRLGWTEEDEEPVVIPVPDELQDLPLLPGGTSLPSEEPD